MADPTDQKLERRAFYFVFGHNEAVAVAEQYAFHAQVQVTGHKCILKFASTDEDFRFGPIPLQGNDPPDKYAVITKGLLPSTQLPGLVGFTAFLPPGVECDPQMAGVDHTVSGDKLQQQVFKRVSSIGFQFIHDSSNKQLVDIPLLVPIPRVSIAANAKQIDGKQKGKFPCSLEVADWASDEPVIAVQGKGLPFTPVKSDDLPRPYAAQATRQSIAIAREVPQREIPVRFEVNCEAKNQSQFGSKARMFIDPERTGFRLWDADTVIGDPWAPDVKAVLAHFGVRLELTGLRVYSNKKTMPKIATIAASVQIGERKHSLDLEGTAVTDSAEEHEMPKTKEKFYSWPITYRSKPFIVLSPSLKAPDKAEKRQVFSGTPGDVVVATLSKGGGIAAALQAEARALCSGIAVSKLGEKRGEKTPTPVRLHSWRAQTLTLADGTGSRPKVTSTPSADITVNMPAGAEPTTQPTSKCNGSA